MATNPFFNQKHPGEQNLIENMTTEHIKMFGWDMVYVPREMINEDKIFGEAGWYKFEDAFPIEMYIESVNGFEGSGDIITKFGLQVKDKVTLIVSRKRFQNEVTSIREEIVRPREGDLVYFPLSNGLFEINFVEHENPFYVIGKNYTYKLSCELFTYDHSKMATGVDTIDSVETDNNSVPVLLLITKIPGITLYGFYEGETVKQYKETPGITGGITGSEYTEGVVVSYINEKSYAYVTLEDPYDLQSFSKGMSAAFGNTILYGTLSGAKQYISGVSGSNMIIPRNSLMKENFGDNDIISVKSKTDSVINYCDKDPFGENSI